MKRTTHLAALTCTLVLSQIAGPSRVWAQAEKGTPPANSGQAEKASSSNNAAEAPAPRGIQRTTPQSTNNSQTAAPDASANSPATQTPKPNANGSPAKPTNDPELLISLRAQQLRRELSEVEGVLSQLRQGRDLTASDIRSWPEFCRRLRVSGEQKLVPIAAVWELLSEPARKAAASLEKDGSLAAEQTVLLDGLKGILANRELAKRAGLAVENLPSEEAKFLLSRAATLSDSEGRRLNRILLEIGFPAELRQSKPEPVLWAMVQRDANAKDAQSGEASSTLFYLDPNTRDASTARKSDSVQLTLSIPELAGPLRVSFEDGQQVVFIGTDPKTITVRNTGSLRYRFHKDVGYPREVTWSREGATAGDSAAISRSLALYTINPQTRLTSEERR